jgi:hypothetical protein
MKALHQAGPSGRVPAPPEKRFLISYQFSLIPPFGKGVLGGMYCGYRR